jgi:aspartate/tyrosine/aromatic aminotransferase
VLADKELRSQWENELTAMRERIHAMRRRFVEGMRSAAPKHDFAFLLDQKGMFSFSGLTNLQVDELRTRHAIDLVGNGGRMNVAGLTEETIPHVCRAIAAVLA